MGNNKKQVTLGQFLTDDQIKEAFKLKKASLICEKIIEPNINEIDKKLGQKNSPLYLAYLCEYLFIKIKEY